MGSQSVHGADNPVDCCKIATSGRLGQGIPQPTQWRWKHGQPPAFYSILPYGSFKQEQENRQLLRGRRSGSFIGLWASWAGLVFP